MTNMIFNKFKLLLSSPFLLLLFFTFNPVKVWGQGTVITPDCVVFVNITTVAGSPATITVPNSPWFDNRTLQCQTWTIGYQALAVSGSFTSLSVQSANDTVTPLTGAFADWSGTVNTGINPNTNQTGAISTLSTGCLSMVSCTVPNSYIRILLTRNNFVGTVNGVLYGYRSGPILSVSATVMNASCPGTVATPCVVDGVTAAGVAPTTPPVLIGGQDGAPGNIRTILTDATGQTIPSNASSADADGVSNTEATLTGAAGGILYPRVFNRVYNGTAWDRMPGNTSGIPAANASLAGADGVSNTAASPSTLAGSQIYARQFPYIFNGATNDRQFNCPNQAVITFSAASGTLQIVALSAGKIIYICHISLSSTVATNITFVYGTGTNCGTGQGAISGTYQQVTSMALDLGSIAAMRTIASNEFCVTSSVVATVGGMVSYAQF